MAGVARRNLVTKPALPAGGGLGMEIFRGRYNEIVSFRDISGDMMTSTNNFWPLDYDPEEQIYENLSWDLPGFRPARNSTRSLATQRKSLCNTPHI